MGILYNMMSINRKMVAIIEKRLFDEKMVLLEYPYPQNRNVKEHNPYGVGLNLDEFTASVSV